MKQIRYVTVWILSIAVSPALFCDIYKTEPVYPNPPAPAWWKSTVADIDAAVQTIQAGRIEVITRSPGDRPLYLISYGTAIEFEQKANYNSAVAARKPENFADKPEGTPPIVFIVGPPHGHEVEGIVGLLNLIRVAETGSDLRGKAWPELKQSIDSTRLLITPCSNPDGRSRCPYDSFVGIPVNEMTRIGQGTRQDGSLWGWPGTKQVHPMKGDVGFLGAYFNNDGVNPMHDEFFAPMANETKALLDTARKHAPDYILNLHSHGHAPLLLRTAYVPRFHEEIRHAISRSLEAQYRSRDLPAGETLSLQIDGEQYPPPSFNLTSALHHVCGAVSILFECPHGLQEDQYPDVNHDEILDIQMLLYQELLAFANRYPQPHLFLQTHE